MCRVEANEPRPRQDCPRHAEKSVIVRKTIQAAGFPVSTCPHSPQPTPPSLPSPSGQPPPVDPPASSPPRHPAPEAVHPTPPSPHPEPSASRSYLASSLIPPSRARAVPESG